MQLQGLLLAWVVAQGLDGVVASLVHLPLPEQDVAHQQQRVRVVGGELQCLEGALPSAGDVAPVEADSTEEGQGVEVHGAAGQGLVQRRLGLVVVFLEAMQLGEEPEVGGVVGLDGDELVEVLEGLVEAATGHAHLRQGVEREGLLGVEGEGQAGLVLGSHQPALGEQRLSQQRVGASVVGLLPEHRGEGALGGHQLPALQLLHRQPRTLGEAHPSTSTSSGGRSSQLRARKPSSTIGIPFLGRPP